MTATEIGHWALGDDGVCTARLNPAVARLWLSQDPGGEPKVWMGTLHPTYQEFVVETDRGFAVYEHHAECFREGAYLPTTVVEDGTSEASRLKERLFEDYKPDMRWHSDGDDQ